MPLPQNDLDAERGVLGSLLSDPSAWDVASEIVFPDAFTDPGHLVVANAIWDLAKRRKPIDLVTVGGAIRDAGRSEDIDPSLIFSLAGAASSVESVIRAYSERVRLLWAVRQRRQIALEILNDGDEKTGIEEKLGRDAQRLLGIEVGSTKKERHQRDVLMERFEQLDKEAKEGPDGRRKKLIDTGIKALDSFLLGMTAGEPVLIAARPSVGKSAMCIALTEYAASLGIPVLIYWLEDFATAWSNRTLSRRTQVPAPLLQHGSSLRKEHWEAMVPAMDRTAEWPIWIDDTHDLTARQIAQRITRFRRELPRKHDDQTILVIADHLGEMRLEREERWGERHDLALGQSMRIFRNACKAANAVPVLMAQLGRENEKRGGEARLSDIFGTGEAEQIVRQAIFLRREQKKDGGRVVSDKLFANILKNTHGPKGEVELGWDPQTMAVKDATDRVAEEVLRTAQRRALVRPSLYNDNEREDD